MNILALIPARMGSSRFPGKPMAEILGMPMIGHVYNNVSKANAVTMTAVATCDEVIYEYIESIGGIAVMTKNTYERASDRCAEALTKIEKSTGIVFDIVVMVQGDEPMTHPDMLDEAIKPMLADSSIMVTNLLGRIDSLEEFHDRNCIKVVCDLQSNAIYFSREPIPNHQNTITKNIFKQYGIIIFKRNFLLKYLKMDPTPLEVLESIDMLRIVENRLPLKMILSKFNIYTVDTPSELVQVEDLIRLNNNN